MKSTTFKWLGLATAMASSSVAAFDRYEMSSSTIDAVQSAILTVLKDPDSAKFGEVGAAVASDGSVVVCGNVNAKNSFGGYIGQMPFVGHMSGGEFVVEQVAATADEAVRIIVRCENLGAMKW
ncbi:hypothetical protein [Mesorhizobium sp. M0203]|uniref:hypothetical protein n=1 Tax=Mesorhizobium sp. M0203 TaxID=2956912 RepID=UPI00333D19A7